MKPKPENMTKPPDDNSMSELKDMRAIVIRIGLLLVLLGIIVIFGFWIKFKFQSDEMKYQSTQQLSAEVLPSATNAITDPIVSQTPFIQQNAQSVVIDAQSTSISTENTTTQPGIVSTAEVTDVSAAQTINLCSPIEGVPISELESIISQAFNVPNQHSDSGHHGVDLGSYNFHGQYLYEIPVRAILSGQVAGITVNRPPIGNVIILETKYEDLPLFLQESLDIEPGQSLYHMYAHLENEPALSIGTNFTCGDTINLLGKSQTVEAHLHLETRIGKSGQVISQMAFYDTATTEEERAEYLWWRTSGEMLAIDPMTIFQTYLALPENSGSN